MRAICRMPPPWLGSLRATRNQRGGNPAQQKAAAILAAQKAVAAARANPKNPALQQAAKNAQARAAAASRAAAAPRTPQTTRKGAQKPQGKKGKKGKNPGGQVVPTTPKANPGPISPQQKADQAAANASKAAAAAAANPSNPALQKAASNAQKRAAGLQKSAGKPPKTPQTRKVKNPGGQINPTTKIGNTTLKKGPVSPQQKADQAKLNAAAAAKAAAANPGNPALQKAASNAQKRANGLQRSAGKPPKTPQTVKGVTQKGKKGAMSPQQKADQAKLNAAAAKRLAAANPGNAALQKAASNAQKRANGLQRSAGKPPKTPQTSKGTQKGKQSSAQAAADQAKLNAAAAQRLAAKNPGNPALQQAAKNAQKKASALQKAAGKSSTKKSKNPKTPNPSGIDSSSSSYPAGQYPAGQYPPTPYVPGPIGTAVLTAVDRSLYPTAGRYPGGMFSDGTSYPAGNYISDPANYSSLAAYQAAESSAMTYSESVSSGKSAPVSVSKPAGAGGPSVFSVTLPSTALGKLKSNISSIFGLNKSSFKLFSMDGAQMGGAVIHRGGANITVLVSIPAGSDLSKIPVLQKKVASFGGTTNLKPVVPAAAVKAIASANPVRTPGGTTGGPQPIGPGGVMRRPSPPGGPKSTAEVNPATLIAGQVVQIRADQVFGDVLPGDAYETYEVASRAEGEVCADFGNGGKMFRVCGTPVQIRNAIQNYDPPGADSSTSTALLREAIDELHEVERSLLQQNGGYRRRTYKLR